MAQRNAQAISEFRELFALAQAAPGPNMMITSLVGWRVAGIAGHPNVGTAFVLASYAAANGETLPEIYASRMLVS